MQHQQPISVSRRKWGLFLLFAIPLAGLFLNQGASWVRDEQKVERRLYVTVRSGMDVYDIDDGHRLLRNIPLPDTGAFKGIAASIYLGKLYITSNVRDELICFDLETETITWRKSFGKYADSMAVTPDGKTIYLPCRHEGEWWAIDAETGDVLARIETGRGQPYEVDRIADYGPHNTVISGDGKHAYLAVLTLPDIFIADTSTHRITGKVGPFSRGVRPLALADDERYIFANVDGLLGFEVGDVNRGQVIHRVEAKTPAERIPHVVNRDGRKPHSTYSHGINVRPGGKEVWVCNGIDGYLHVFDITHMPPRWLADVPLFESQEEQPKPGWVSFSIDGRYAYPSTGVVIDADSWSIVARIAPSEKLLEVDLNGGKPVRAGLR